MKQFSLLSLLLLILGITSCTGTSGERTELSVMTFNIRYDNPEDGAHNWSQRKDIAAEMIKEQDCDLIGAQEVLHNQLEDLQERLPQYEAVGVGREDGKTKGEYSAIFYKKDKFTPVDNGCFWLSETPDVPGSKGWDAACERIATWVILKEKKTGKEFFFINTHLDHMGKAARKEGVDLLLRKTGELNRELPTIATGDFNAGPSSDVIKEVLDATKSTHWIHTRDVSPVTKGTPWSFHNFDKLETNQRELIDYIFTSPDVQTKYYEVLPITFKDTLVSDHAPVVAKVVL